MKPNVIEKRFVARAVIYNLLTVDLELPINVGMFTINAYPDRVALEYHLGQAEQTADWDARYPKWHVYIEFPLNVRIDSPHADKSQTESIAVRVLSKFLTILQLYSTTPLGGRVHAIRPTNKIDFTEEDITIFQKDIGANPSEADVYFVARDNLEAVRTHFDSLWDKDLRLISLATSRYMHSYERDIFAEGFEPDDAFMDLMLSLENLFGSPEAVGYKVALRAACLLEHTGERAKTLNKIIKDWYKVRSKIAHGNVGSAVEWKDVEELRKVVRQAIMAIWEIQRKGDNLDDYLFFGSRFPTVPNSLPPSSTDSK